LDRLRTDPNSKHAAGRALWFSAIATFITILKNYFARTII